MTENARSINGQCDSGPHQHTELLLFIRSLKTVESQATDWEEALATCLSGKGTIYAEYVESSQHLKITAKV